MRIMLVDDVEMNRELVEIGLRRAGHVVVGHASAEAAISALCEACDVDVILMDVQMPGMDGLTATRAIRGMSGRAGMTPIIGLSANVLPEQVEACLAAGMDDHVGKPVRMPLLLERLHAIAGRQGTPEPVAPGRMPDAAMDALRERYVSHLLTQIPELRRLVDATEGPANGASLAALSHSIAGTAGSMGFAQVSDVAFKLEAAGRRVESGKAPICSIAADVEALIDAISTVERGVIDGGGLACEPYR
jgi:CheY-like chemotaxis protein